MFGQRVLLGLAPCFLVALSLTFARAGGEELDCEAIKINTLDLLRSEVAPLLRPQEFKDGKNYVRSTLPEEFKLEGKRLLECSTLSKKLWVRDGKEITTDFMGAYVHVSVLQMQLQVLLESQEQGILREFLEGGFVENVESTYSKINHSLTSPPSK